MREVTLTGKILKYLKVQGCFAVKWHGSVYGAGGMPDIYVLVPHSGFPIPVHIEVKVPGNTPTPRQRKILRDLSDVGVVAFWTDNLDDVQYVIETLRRSDRVVIDAENHRVYRPR